VNALPAHRSGPTSAPDPGGTLKEQTDVLSNYLHEMTQTLRRVDNVAPFREPFAACVTRLRRAELLPKKIAAMMLTINAMRVEVVKDRIVLGTDEWLAVQAIWTVLERWKRSLSN